MVRSFFIFIALALVLNSCMTGRAISLAGSRPTDLNECFGMLDSVLAQDKREQIKAVTEDEFRAKAYLGLGQWIRNNWWLWEKGELSQTFTALGITNTEGMADIVLTSYHRYLTNKPLEVEAQIEHTKKQWCTHNLRKLVESDSADSVPLQKASSQK